MTQLDHLQALLAEIDSLLDTYQPGTLEPDRILGDIIGERAAQRPLFERVVHLATDGLLKFPFNAELLRRRALARSFIVTPEMTYPEIELAEQDLRTLLAVEPNNLHAAFDLLETMFTFSGLENSEVAEIAALCATKAEQILLKTVALQIKALGYADDHGASQAVYDRWKQRFPESSVLTIAKEDADSMKAT